MHIASANADLNVKLEQMTGRPGVGLHQVRFDLRATAVPGSALRGTYALVDGSVEVGSETMFRHAGHLRAERPLALPAVTDVNVESTFTLAWDLTREQLEAIEILRKDGPPYLRANLRLYLFQPDQAPSYAWETVNLPVDVATWATVLEQAGYAQTLVLIIPVPPSDASGVWSEAVSELRTARTAAIEGRYRDAVATARHALELLAQIRPVDLPVSGDKKERSKEQRFEAMRAAIKDVTNAPHHSDAVTRAFEWKREDAVAIVSLVSSFMQWLAASAQQ